MFAAWLKRKLLKPIDRRMPLKEPPLRVPAQTLSENFDDKLIDLVAKVIGFPTLLALWFLGNLATDFAAGARAELWARSGIYLSVVLLAILIVLRWAKGDIKELRNYYLGMLAERFVGQQLERSRAFGFSVFHDIEFTDGGRTFNIDHIAIGRQGIFVVETKGKSKPEKGQTRVRFDGKFLHFTDGTKTDEHINQIEANVARARELLFQLIQDKPNPVCRFHKAEQLPITGLVVYPGWYVERDRFPKKNLAVLSDKPMLRYLRRCHPILSREEAYELGNLLGKHLRDQRRGTLLD